MRLKELIVIAWALFLSAACTDGGEPVVVSPLPADGVIRVSAAVAEPFTRAGGEGMTAASLTRFCLHIENKQDEAYTYTALMQKENGSWEAYRPVADGNPSEPLTMLWADGTTPVNVTATTLPVTDFGNEAAVEVEADQSVEADFAASDYLYTAPHEVNPATGLVGGKLPVELRHLCSRVNIVLDLSNTDADENPVSDLRLEGVSLSRNFNLLSNQWGTAGAAASLIPLRAEYVVGPDGGGAQALYSALLVPQTVKASQFTVGFLMADSYYEWTLEQDMTFDSGKVYTLNLIVGGSTAGRTSVLSPIGAMTNNQ